MTKREKLKHDQTLGKHQREREKEIVREKNFNKEREREREREDLKIFSLTTIRAVI